MKPNPVEKLVDVVTEVFMLAMPGKPFYPQSGQTFCNEAVNQVLIRYGYTKFNKPNPGNSYGAIWANSIVWEMLNNKEDWTEITGDVAYTHMNEGAIVIAGQQNPEGHGHVCTIMPGALIKSGHWNKLVPKVMNIGKDVFIGKAVSYAFINEPQYFLLNQTLNSSQGVSDETQ